MNIKDREVDKTRLLITTSLSQKDKYLLVCGRVLTGSTADNGWPPSRATPDLHLIASQIK